MGSYLMSPEALKVMEEHLLIINGLSGNSILYLLQGIIPALHTLIGFGHQVLHPGRLQPLLILDLLQSVCHRRVSTEERLRPFLSRVDILEDGHEPLSLLLVALVHLVEGDECLLQGCEAHILILDPCRVVLHSLLHLLLHLNI